MRTKVFYIIGIALVALGITAFVIGFAGVGFNEDRLAGAVYEVKAVELGTESITSVKVDSDVADLRVQMGTELSVTYEDGGEHVYTTKVSGGEVFVHEKCKWSLSIVSGREPVITVTVPSLGDNISVSFESDTGDMVIDGGAYDKVRFDSDTGDLTAKNAVIDTLGIEVDTGDIELSRVVATSVIITTDTGEVDMNDCTYGDISVEVDTGDIDLEQISAQSVRIKSETGDIGYKGQMSSGSFISGTGDVELELVDTGYYVWYRTSTGDARIRTDSGEKRIEITTVTGDITVK